ncbi:HAD family hydrolase [Sporosalibacterium faouarense]|uniref:HAD family hydrolase n=1 Tax=Sporosalibacterium faouarense TaxID=516123 RepID=UPI00192C6688|nr:HAD hydrolase-like protein [Sporosalibacterium faouarense]
MANLIFFDINGTIIKRDDRTDIPYQKAINTFLKVEDGMNGVNTSARSDKDVFIEVLGKYNQNFTNEKWDDFLKVYEEQLETFKFTDVWRENADAKSIISKLSKTNHKLALITGELSLGARYKLEKIGVWKYFPIGGFGEDGLKRFDIAETALNKTKKLYDCNFENIFIIGDTILDIKTARHLGAKVISIATGSNTKEELVAEKPDYIINEFAEIEHLFL